MFRKKDSTKANGLVFYVDEDADDFTFYLERDEKNTVIKALLGDRAKQFKSGKTGIADDEMFTLSEEVVVKSLFLTKDSFRQVDDSFWEKLQDPIEDSAYYYLDKKLEAIVESASEGKDKLDKSLERLKEGNLDDKDKEILLPCIIQALNEAIRRDSLRSESWVDNNLPKREKALIAALPNEETKEKWRNRVFLQTAFSDLIKESQTGRGLICFSYVGKYLSVTFRRLTAKAGYEAKGSTNRREHLFGLDEYCDLMYKEVFKRTDSTEHAHGLLVVTGSTKSAKSEIARALIHLYLTRKKNRKRKPHLVTFEDPVEKFYAYEMAKGPFPWAAIERSNSSVIDYTPRQKGRDVALLRDALTDALRQTPTAFFVGETRNKREWELLLDFAATGHLIVTTAHASSLVEAMHKIFEARDVKTPADRSEIANKLFAVIHLRVGNIVINETKIETKTGTEAKIEIETSEVLFPALWRRTGRGVAALTSDGLASLLPHRSIENKSNEGPSCLGRRWLVECLIKSAEKALSTFFDLEKPFGKSKQSLKMRTYKRATEWDLEGV